MGNAEKPPSRKLLFPAFIATVVLGIILFWIDQNLRVPASSPLGIVSFELAKLPATAEFILAGWGDSGQNWALASLLLDFPFLVAYTALFVLLTAASRSDIKQLFLIGFLMAGFCDFIENLLLLFILQSAVLPQLTTGAYYFASLKFMLLFAGWAFLATRLLLWSWEKLMHAAKPPPNSSQA